MNVLSLFDGMSGARLALDKAKIKVTNYYASEIDKYAIKVSKANYPDIIQLGDVTQIDWFGLPQIDLLIGGFPCQAFSFAGKQLNFNDPRGKLFFECVRLLKTLQPKYFIFENVVMKKEYQDIISAHIGVEPIMINSSLLSAQNRKRLYWTNIPNVTQPQDKNILLKDILETDITSIGCAMRGRFLDENGKRLDSTVESQSGLTKQRIELRTDGKSNCLTSVQKDSLCIQVGAIGKGGQGNRIYSTKGKSCTLNANSGGLAGKGNLCIQVGEADIKGITWRKLTPIECERLQTIPDNYTAHVSNSQRYKMIGNGFTIDVIAHILNTIKG